MQKLTPSQLGRRLGYGLKVTKDDWGKIFKLDADGTTLNHVGIDFVIRKEAKPILFPLSFLTKEISIKGYNDDKLFVPIEKMLLDHWEGHDIEVVVEVDKYLITAKAKYKGSETIEEELELFIPEHFLFPHWVIELLLKWHFVIDEPEGSYIPVTDEFNPYE